MASGERFADAGRTLAQAYVAIFTHGRGELDEATVLFGGNKIACAAANGVLRNGTHLGIFQIKPQSWLTYGGHRFF